MANIRRSDVVTFLNDIKSDSTFNNVLLVLQRIPYRCNTVDKARYTYLLARYYGLLEKECEMLKQASPMHNIGKVAIPNSILNKPARFTPEEFEKMKECALLGYDMLKHSNRSLLKMASIVAYEHHKKWNIKG